MSALVNYRQNCRYNSSYKKHSLFLFILNIYTNGWIEDELWLCLEYKYSMKSTRMKYNLKKNTEQSS